MSDNNEVSKYLCFILRHAPTAIGLDMDIHGWVNIEQLIEKVNAHGKYSLTLPQLKTIVYTDEKKRYEMTHDSIRCVQGHSLEWVEPDMTYKKPPEYLYHGTTDTTVTKIIESGGISKMKRHDVHLTEDPSIAYQSASRWKNLGPALIVIRAQDMYNDGRSFGVTKNNVWCTKQVPNEYICQIITDEKEIHRIISEYKK